MKYSISKIYIIRLKYLFSIIIYSQLVPLMIVISSNI